MAIATPTQTHSEFKGNADRPINPAVVALKEIIERRKISTEVLAQGINFVPSSLVHVLNGTKELSLHRWFRIEKYLGLEEGSLADKSEMPYPKTEDETGKVFLRARWRSGLDRKQVSEKLKMPPAQLIYLEQRSAGVASKKFVTKLAKLYGEKDQELMLEAMRERWEANYSEALRPAGTLGRLFYAKMRENIDLIPAVAKKLRCSQAAVILWVNGAIPNHKFLERVAKYLETPLPILQKKLEVRLKTLGARHPDAVETTSLFGRALLAYMKDKNVSLARVAKRLKKNKSTVSRWIHGETFPQSRMFPMLSKTLGVSTEKIEAWRIDFHTQEIRHGHRPYSRMALMHYGLIQTKAIESGVDGPRPSLADVSRILERDTLVPSDDLVETVSRVAFVINQEPWMGEGLRSGTRTSRLVERANDRFRRQVRLLVDETPDIHPTEFIRLAVFSLDWHRQDTAVERATDVSPVDCIQLDVLRSKRELITTG